MVKNVKKEVATVNIRIFPSTHGRLKNLATKARRSIAVTVDELSYESK